MSESVLLVCGDYPPFLSGIADYTERLARAMASLGSDVRVLTTAGAGAEPEASGAVRVLRGMPAWRMRDIPRVLRAVDEAGPGTVVHIQYTSVAYRRNPMINLLPLVLRAARPANPVVVTLHDVRVMRHRWRLRTLPMILAADSVVYVDPPDGEVIARMARVRASRLRCIPTAATIEPVPAPPGARARWREELGLAGDDPVIAFFGILYPHKGLLELAEAVRRLRAAGVRARLLVIGGFDRETPFEAQVEEALAEGRGAGWARWLRDAPADAVSRALHAADLAALPFHSGATSNRTSLLAALEHGLPVVTTRGPATPADFATRFPAALVPPGRVEPLVEALAATIRDLPLAGARGGGRPAAVPGWAEVARANRELHADLRRRRGA